VTAMKNSKRVFVAAWEYPPILSGESVVCRKTLEHSAHDYDVCCGPVPAGGDEHVRLFPAGGNKYLRWPFAAARQFEQINQEAHYQVMMSRVMPPNGHLAGWLIKRRHPDVRWIAYFSDPVWNSPFLKLSLRNDGSHRPRWLLMKLFGIPAKWALRRADRLMFNNERLARYVLGRQYEALRDKVLLVPYGHEGVHARPAPARGDGKLRLTHVGQIYGDRTLGALVDGAELLQKKAPALFDRLSIRQVGFVCEAERQRVANSPAAAAFTLVEQVPYDESIEEMYQADWLAVIDPVFDDPRKDLYIPGKIYDYLATGRPIVCIARRDSATGDVATSAGLVLTPPEGEQVSRTLQTLLTGGEHPVSLEAYARHSCDAGEQVLDAAINALQNR
jgi:hypothetical protein